MGLLDWIGRLYYERDISGNHFYKKTSKDFKDTDRDLLTISQNHPLLTPALLFVSQLFAQGKFIIRNKNTGAIKKSHWILDLLENPNYYQSSVDFLEAFQFMKVALGSVGIYTKAPNGMTPTELYLLNTNLIEYPKDFNTKMDFRDKINDDVQVIYDKNGENLKLKLKDIMFFYDLPNGLRVSHEHKNNYFICRSRLDGIIEVLVNTNDSVTAKNIILKSNGKELISGGSNTDGFPLTPEEKIEAEQLFSLKYGLSKSRSRTMITKADLKYQSLHIALRDLGLDESVKTDANIIFTALHIPKDILSLDNKKTTYANQKESMVSYIQSDMTSALNDFSNSIGVEFLEKGWELVGTYDHLPVMQFIKVQKYEVIKKQADALSALIKVGIPPALALEMVDINSLITLTPPQNETTAGQGTQGEDTSGE